MPEAARRKSEIPSITQRIDTLDWKGAAESLSDCGYAVTAPILSPAECASIVALTKMTAVFAARSSWSGIARHRGLQIFRESPSGNSRCTPDRCISASRRVANHWAEALGEDIPRYPRDHAAFVNSATKPGKQSPRRSCSHYEAGGYNCLHQDLTAKSAFRCRWFSCSGSTAATGKAENSSWSNNNLVAQSKPQVVLADQGRAILFTTRYRPVKGSRGYYRVNLRHGVSRVHRGTRYTLGSSSTMQNRGKVHEPRHAG